MRLVRKIKWRSDEVYGTMGPVPYPRQYSGIGITVNVKGDFRFSASNKEVASRGFSSHVFLVIFISVT